MRNDGIESAVIWKHGEEISQVTHRDTPTEPGLDECFPRQWPNLIDGTIWPRVVGENHDLVPAARQTIGERVRRALDATPLLPLGWQSVTEHRET
jgi:hypothetical protein